jgi:hypothetical protein
MQMCLGGYGMKELTVETSAELHEEATSSICDPNLTISCIIGYHWLQHVFVLELLKRLL